jgi:hypothetical protein
MKVAINRCFGGFGISNEAFEILLDLKGIAFETVREKSGFLGDSYYRAGHVGDDKYYLSQHTFCEDRADTDLIAVIESLGEASWGFAAEIAIVEVPDDVKWHIHEYDGLEHVAEDHRTWS